MLGHLFHISSCTSASLIQHFSSESNLPWTHTISKSSNMKLMYRDEETDSGQGSSLVVICRSFPDILVRERFYDQSLYWEIPQNPSIVPSPFPQMWASACWVLILACQSPSQHNQAWCLMADMPIFLLGLHYPNVTSSSPGPVQMDGWRVFHGHIHMHMYVYSSFNPVPLHCS